MMNIDKGRLVKNPIIYAVIAVALTAIFAATGTGDSLGSIVGLLLLLAVFIASLLFL